MNTAESLPVTLYYELLNGMDAAAQSARPMTLLLEKETGLFLDGLPDDATRMAALEAKLKAVHQTSTHPPFTPYLDEEYHNGLIGEGFRKDDTFPEIQSIITWVREKDIAPDQPLSEYDYQALKATMTEELVRYYYSRAATSYLHALIWKIEGRMAMARGYRADTGLRWNLTGKAPFTKTDFENLVSALWEKKFITHTSGKKELAMKALYGVFDLPAPGKTGTNRHKAKAASTTLDNSYELFDRLKAAHQEYLNAGLE
jgi:hypothetical protein